MKWRSLPSSGLVLFEMLCSAHVAFLVQDAHLEHLSSSIGRQHHISLQINDELETQTGLFDELDTELDGTDSRMRRARRRLDRVARGAKENGRFIPL